MESNVKSLERECKRYMELSDDYIASTLKIKEEHNNLLEYNQRHNADQNLTLYREQQIIDDLNRRLKSVEDDNHELLKANEVLVHEFEMKKANLLADAPGDEIKAAIRELENKNAEMQKILDSINTHLDEYAVQLDNAFEKRAMLELEIEEGDNLSAQLDRLRDVVNDLKDDVIAKDDAAVAELDNGVYGDHDEEK